MSIMSRILIVIRNKIPSSGQPLYSEYKKKKKRKSPFSYTDLPYTPTEVSNE
jgi:hypothetical protein